MITHLIESLKCLPRELIVLIAAALPVVEVRGSVPLGLLYFHLGTVKVMLISLIGGVLPVIPILWFLKNITEPLRTIKLFDRFFSWLFEHTRKRSQLVSEFELVGLTIFMALPIPGAGIWTGCVAAYLLDIAWLPAFFCAIIGTAIAILIVWLASLGLVRLI